MQAAAVEIDGGQLQPDGFGDAQAVAEHE